MLSSASCIARVAHSIRNAAKAPLAANPSAPFYFLTLSPRDVGCAASSRESWRNGSSKTAVLTAFSSATLEEKLTKQRSRFVYTHEKIDLCSPRVRCPGLCRSGPPALLNGHFAECTSHADES